MYPLPPGSVLVESGPHDDIDDLPGAQAPAVSADAIEVALLDSYERWRELDEAAQGAVSEVWDRWSWDKQLAPWIKSLKGEA
jgi:hypothetical protein